LVTGGRAAFDGVQAAAEARLIVTEVRRERGECMARCTGGAAIESARRSKSDARRAKRLPLHQLP